MNSLKKRVVDGITSIDLFGHPIELNFNNRGSRHNTIIGGFISIFIRLGLLLYVIRILILLFTYSNNMERISTFTLVEDSNFEQTVQNVKYTDLMAALFLVFRWQF